MDIKKELKEILQQINANTTVAHDDAGENGTDVVILEDFEPSSEDSEDPKPEVIYNRWYERLKQLIEII